MALISTYARNEPFIGAESAYFLEDYTTSEITVQLNSSNELSATAVGLLAINKNLGTNLSTTIAAIGTLNLNKNLGTNLSTTIVSNGFYTIENPLLAQANITSAVSGFYAIENPLQTSIQSFVSSVGTATLDHQLQSNYDQAQIVAVGTIGIFKYLSAEPLFFINTFGEIESLRPVNSNLSINLSVLNQLNITKHLESTNNIEFSTTGTGELSAAIQGIISCDIMSSGQLNLTNNLPGIINLDITTEGSITVERNLISAIECEISSTILQGFTFVNSITTINTSIHALLDVNGNTVGSPGGIPSEGFEPPNSLLLARHSESDAAQTYFITADFSSIENPNINTEIIGYSLSEQLPQDIVEFSMEGSVLAIRLNTPSPILPFFVRFRTKDHQLKTRLNTFVTGEQHRVDYFLLDKKSIPIELKINVVARSYDSFGNTLEVRNADYILIIIGDYSISRNKLLSALETGGL